MGAGLYSMMYLLNYDLNTHLISSIRRSHKVVSRQVQREQTYSCLPLERSIAN